MELGGCFITTFTTVHHLSLPCPNNPFLCPSQFWQAQLLSFLVRLRTYQCLWQKSRNWWSWLHLQLILKMWGGVGHMGMRLPSFGFEWKNCYLNQTDLKFLLVISIKQNTREQEVWFKCTQYDIKALISLKIWGRRYLEYKTWRDVVISVNVAGSWRYCSLSNTVYRNEYKSCIP